MQQSPSWEANRFAASQEMPRVLWNPKVHHRIHKCPPSVHILSHIDTIHFPTSHFLKLNINIILPSKPASFELRLSLRFPHHNLLHNSPPPPHVLHAPPILFFSIWSPDILKATSVSPIIPTTAVPPLVPVWGRIFQTILISHVFEINMRRIKKITRFQEPRKMWQEWRMEHCNPVREVTDDVNV